jgi:ribose transport system permease protein
LSVETTRRPAPWALLRASFQKASALWVFAAIFILFALWVPSTFLATGTWRSLLDEQAITALVAIGLVLPLAAGAFDLAVGTEVGVGSILVAWLLTKGMPVLPAVVLSVLAGGVIGLTSGWLIVKVHIDSFISTLGISSILLAVISWISRDTQIIGLSTGFQKLGNTQLLGLVLPFYIMLVVAAAVYYFLEHTASGRRVYATGGNLDSARLAGVNTSRVLVGTLVACGMIACFAGMLVSSSLATGDPTIGPPYLLPAFSAVFLGSTQFRGGRFNVWGTVLAVYVLATGVKGLQLAGAPTWIPDLFDGVALLIAVGIAKHQRSGGRVSAIRRIVSRGGSSGDVSAAGAGEPMAPLVATSGDAASEAADGSSTHVVGPQPVANQPELDQRTPDVQVPRRDEVNSSPDRQET